MSDLDLIYGTQPKTPPSAGEQEKEKAPSTKQEQSTKALKKASTSANTLAGNQASMIEVIRKTVKPPGKEVAFTRVTPEEKGKLADIVYTYKRQWVKTSENEVNRIAISFLIEDYHKHGKESVLAQELEVLSA